MSGNPKRLLVLMAGGVIIIFAIVIYIINLSKNKPSADTIISSSIIPKGHITTNTYLRYFVDKPVSQSVHNISISNFTSETTTAKPGDAVYFTYTVTNNGSGTESNVTTTLQKNGLNIGRAKTIKKMVPGKVWNVRTGVRIGSGMKPGAQIPINAYVPPVVGESATSDNTSQTITITVE